MKKLWIILVLALILAAGCIGQREVTTTANNGITINMFTATPVSARTGELVLFDLEVENTGGTTARNVQVDLFGVENQWRTSTGSMIDSTLTKPMGTLKPPLPDRSIPGDFKMQQWDIMTPNIPQGVSPALDIEAWVSYDYNTSGHLKVKAVSEDEWRRKQLQGEEILNPVEIINSNGPIKLSIPANYQNAIIVDTQTSDEDYVVQPFRIEFQNVGSGYPITLEDDGTIRGAGGRLHGTLQLFGPGVEFEDCLGATSGTIVDFNDAQIPVRLRESAGGTLPVACSIRIDKDVWATRAEDTFQFVFNIFYRYYTKQTATVTVTGV